ncbi:MAG: threonine synthase [Clostridia bacterium]|nr:threonine synthase [Clostridia bacterium]
MKFLSTRGKDVAKNAAEAIVKGLASDGGLFVPETFPNVSNDLDKMLKMNYAERAAFILGKYLEEYDKAELLSACKDAYSKFDDEDVVPVVKTDDGFYILELFHGPTLAFKDVALTLLPYLLRKGADIVGIKEKILILVATSGDTGKAALEGFRDKDGCYIMVFYPSEGVSDMQKLQMCTQEGANVNVVAVKGNFDDCQTAVKKIFSDKNVNAELKEKGIVLSSANSINFGRLAPQITYYFSAYLDLVESGEIAMGDKIDFVVPTGNFGDILAGYYAKKMGLPIGKLCCASNSNNVLTEFFSTGEYDSNREFYKTMSPSMDILVSSNLERLLFEICDRDASLTEKRMNELKQFSKYQVSKKEKSILDGEFYADFCDEDECLDTISSFFDEFGYVLDPHTAVAVCCADGYAAYTNSQNPCVVLSTASPFKFSQNVYRAISGKKLSDAFKAAEKLSEETALEIPEQISLLKVKEKRFLSVIDRTETLSAVNEFVDKINKNN